MKVLYIYPHPDDESFGQGHALHKMRRLGHEVYLLTLTKGGATKLRHNFGYSIEQMGEVRYREISNVARVLDLSGMTVLDFPDSGLKEVDPRELEDVVRKEIERIEPQVLVTYPVHGISGFHDHIVTHAVVKRVFVGLRERTEYLKRLAFTTLTEESAAKSPLIRVGSSKPEEIDCVIKADEIDIQKCIQALDCYVTYQETVEKSGIKDFVRQNDAVFEFFQEDHKPPVADLFEALP